MIKTFIVQTTTGVEVVLAEDRAAAAGMVEDFTSVSERDPETQKLCPNMATCGCGVMPASHNFCHKCGTELS